MRAAFAILLCCACTSNLTRYRGGFRGCSVAQDRSITCNGKPMARLECFLPARNACGALAIHYADGQRVFLAAPAGFDADHPQPAENDRSTAFSPYAATDGSVIWFRNGDRSGDWEVYEPDSGQTTSVDYYYAAKLHEQYPDAVALAPQ